MKKGRYLTLMILLLAATIQAQNPGFEGKTMVAGIGLGVGNFHRGSIKASPVFHLEKSISVKNSLRMSFTTRKISSSFEDYNYSISNLARYFGESPEYRDLTMNGELTGNISAKVQSFQFGFRRYITERGAVAPFGLFFDYAFDFSTIQIEEATAETKGTYLRNPLTISLPYVKEYANTQHLSYQMGFGKKLFLQNGHFLEYKASISLNLTENNYRDIQTNMDVAQNIAVQEDSFRSLIILNFVYGLGF